MIFESINFMEITLLSLFLMKKRLSKKRSSSPNKETVYRLLVPAIHICNLILPLLSQSSRFRSRWSCMHHRLTGTDEQRTLAFPYVTNFNRWVHRSQWTWISDIPNVNYHNFLLAFLNHVTRLHNSSLLFFECNEKQ